jgi:hypothetical protein
VVWVVGHGSFYRDGPARAEADRTLPEVSILRPTAVISSLEKT